MSAIDELYYNLDFCRVMSKVTLTLCNNGHGNNPQDQQAAMDSMIERLEALRANPDYPEPADLVEHTSEMVAAERKRWEESRRALEEWLAMPEAARPEVPGGEARVLAKIANAQAWIDAIDLVWPEGS
jgi:hypothetical protein